MAECTTEVKNCCFAGIGRIYLKPYDPCCGAAIESSSAYIGLGNCSSFSIDAAVSELKVPNYMDIGGGTECQTSWIESATAKITGMCFSADNFAKCWSGDISKKAAQTQTIEITVHGLDTFIPFLDADGNPITDVDTAQFVGIGLAADDGPAKPGRDFVATPNGLIIPPASRLVTTNFPSATDVSVTHSEYSLVDMLTTSAKEFSLFYSGVNRFGNKPFSVYLYRVKMNPVNGIPLIGTDVASAEYMLEILRDPCRGEGTGFSQYGSLAI
jgi:hypothetical protein